MIITPELRLGPADIEVLIRALRSLSSEHSMIPLWLALLEYLRRATEEKAGNVEVMVCVTQKSYASW